MGHHADAAAGSDAIYGRELQSAALREYVLVLGAIAEGQFFPDQTRSGHFAPGWSREAILSVAAVPPSSTTTTSNDADDQDEALAVVSDDSDSEDDDTEMPLFWAHPTSQILHRTTLGSAMFLCGRVLVITIGVYPSLELRLILIARSVSLQVVLSDDPWSGREKTATCTVT